MLSKTAQNTSMRSALPEWAALKAHKQKIEHLKIKDLFDNEPARFDDFHTTLGPVLLDYSKQLMTRDTRDKLLSLARACDLEGYRDKMFAGEVINITEDRAVLHTALRSTDQTPLIIDGTDIKPLIKDTKDKMRDFCDAFDEEKAFTHVVNIGIGGSDLGANIVYNALKPFTKKDVSFHFVSNVDASHLVEVLNVIDPYKTLFIITSKTFTTQETLTNATTARDWLREKLELDDVSQYFVAATQNIENAVEFGISEDKIFPIWDWVGGRYSLWSAVGLSCALALGYSQYEDMLDGASEMDRHFQTAPLHENLPVLLGLIGVWNRNFMGYNALSLVPYDQYLAHFPSYMQQLDMESNGKSVDLQGRRVDYKTGPFILGEAGTNAQHAYFQLLHQGTDIMPCDIIMIAKSQNNMGDHHQKLIANALAQSKAFMEGDDNDNPHKIFEGNRPTSTLVLDELNPRTLGMLLALYEHKIFVQGVIWNINSFDQCGVELGKVMAKQIIHDLNDDDISTDCSTSGLLKHIKSIT